MRSNKFLFGIAFVALLLGTFSCEDYLNEPVNKAQIGDDTQWASEGNADIFLNSIYGQLNNMNNTPDYLDNYTDDNDGGIYWRSYVWKQGIVNPSINNGTPMVENNQGPHNNFTDWTVAYQRIRRCNLFIQKVTENKVGTFTPAWSAKRIDEVRFLRAYWYAMLWQHVGGLPIITTVLNNSDGSEIYYARNTFEETSKFITDELEAVITNNKLAVKYNAGNADAGRATLGAALMVKAWVQLYGASEAFNTGTSPTGVADPDNLIHFAAPSTTRWATAAASFKRFMDTYTTYNLFPEMDKLWRGANEYNSEVIWDRQNVGSNVGGLFNQIDQFGGPVNILNVYHTWGNYNPTQELVDAFRMANGKRITDPTSGYNAQAPYVGREPRFYQAIVHDQAVYRQDWMPKDDIIVTRMDDCKTCPQFNGSGSVKTASNRIDFGTDDLTNTAYYFKKKLNNLAPEGGGQNGNNYIYYRFAEVLLGYAEAQNEAVGPDASVYTAVNRIRQRASTNLPALPAGLTQAEMRQEIRDQRRIELCFEAKRFYDIIRWKVAKTLMNLPLHGMKIYNTVPATNAGVWVYEPVELTQTSHVFHDYMYMNPVPQNVLNNNTKLKQNPGY
jgi:hypothetical protein